jgi:cholesterol 24-hydroxylase
MGFMTEFNLKADRLLEKLRKYSDGKVSLSMMDQFSRTALDVICYVAFGMETDALNDSEDKLNFYIAESFRGYTKYMNYIYFYISRLYPSTYTYKKFYRNIIKNLRQIGNDQIMKRIKLLKEDSYIPSDLLTITLKEYENEEVDLDDLIDNFLTFLIAGQETTANTLAFCIIELSKNPTILKKLFLFFILF